jgi:hypothetical protein
MVKRSGDREVSVHKSGNSYGVYLPVEWAKTLRIRKRAVLLMRLASGRLVLGREEKRNDNGTGGNGNGKRKAGALSVEQEAAA